MSLRYLRHLIVQTWRWQSKEGERSDPTPSSQHLWFMQVVQGRSFTVKGWSEEENEIKHYVVFKDWLKLTSSAFSLFSRNGFACQFFFSLLLFSLKIWPETKESPKGLWYLCSKQCLFIVNKLSSWFAGTVNADEPTTFVIKNTPSCITL